MQLDFFYPIRFLRIIETYRNLALKMKLFGSHVFTYGNKMARKTVNDEIKARKIKSWWNQINSTFITRLHLNVEVFAGRYQTTIMSTRYDALQTTNYSFCFLSSLHIRNTKLTSVFSANNTLHYFTYIYSAPHNLRSF